MPAADHLRSAPQLSRRPSTQGLRFQSSCEATMIGTIQDQQEVIH